MIKLSTSQTLTQRTTRVHITSHTVSVWFVNFNLLYNKDKSLIVLFVIHKPFVSASKQPYRFSILIDSTAIVMHLNNTDVAHKTKCFRLQIIWMSLVDHKLYLKSESSRKYSINSSLTQNPYISLAWNRSVISTNQNLPFWHRRWSSLWLFCPGTFCGTPFYNLQHIGKNNYELGQ